MAGEQTRYNDLTNNEEQSEYDMLNARINEKADQSLDATRRILATAIETERVGVETNEKLAAQGQQLERINEKQDRLNEGIKKNKSQLAKLVACCDCFGFQKRRFEASQPDTYTAVKKEADSKHNVKSSPVNAKKGKEDKKAAQAVNTEQKETQYVKRILNDDREEEMEQNLRQVGNIVGNLKGLAMNMNMELEKQDGLLDTLQVKTEANDMEIEALDIKANKMLLGKEKEAKQGGGMDMGGLQSKIAGGAVKNAFKM